MKITYAVCAFVLLICGWCQNAAGDTAAASGKRVVFDFRIAANRSLYEMFVCRVRNESDKQIKVSGANPSPGWALYLGWMDVAPETREWVPLSHWFPTGMRSPSPDLFIEAGSAQEWITREPYGCFADMRDGRYVIWKWQGSLGDPEPDLKMVPPPQILLGLPAADGSIAAPAVGRGEKKATPHLALVVHAMYWFENRRFKGNAYQPLREFAFLLLNGTDAAITTDNPLTPQSAIIVRAPAINYRHELVLSNAVISKTSVAPGTHGEWRMPWQTVLDLIPPADLEKIKAAGGDMDLVWKTGDLESAPLPMTFLPPTQDELDEAFLKKHANLPRIGENTKLSLNFRLADMDANPVLLGTMRNEETNSVVADKRFIDRNLVESSYKWYPFNCGRGQKTPGPFVAEAGGDVVFSETFRGLAEYIGYSKENSSTGMVFCYQWHCMTQHTGIIWVALPDKDGRLGVIRSFADELSPKSPRYRPEPPVAPIIAFVYNGGSPTELAFVVRNRTDIEIAAANPLTPKSRIIASAPAIKYTRELSMPDVKAIDRKIAPNTHTDWRLPWKTVIGLIPSDDLAKIKAAGGELDLTWKVGDWESPPLPVLLSKPEVSKPEKAK
jgi:hypothetical protein